jgi:hypothetical protein
MSQGVTPFFRRKENDAVLLASQEKRQKPKTIQAKHRYGEMFSAWLKKKKGSARPTRALLSEFMHDVIAPKYAATVLQPALSHLTRYIKQHWGVDIPKAELTQLNEWIASKMKFHKTKKASSFTHQQVRDFLTRSTNTRSKCDNTSGFFSPSEPDSKHLKTL